MPACRAAGGRGRQAAAAEGRAEASRELAPRSRLGLSGLFEAKLRRPPPGPSVWQMGGGVSPAQALPRSSLPWNRHRPAQRAARGQTPAGGGGQPPAGRGPGPRRGQNRPAAGSLREGNNAAAGWTCAWRPGRLREAREGSGGSGCEENWILQPLTLLLGLYK